MLFSPRLQNLIKEVSGPLVAGAGEEMFRSAFFNDFTHIHKDNPVCHFAVGVKTLYETEHVRRK